MERLPRDRPTTSRSSSPTAVGLSSGCLPVSPGFSLSATGAHSAGRDPDIWGSRARSCDNTRPCLTTASLPRLAGLIFAVKDNIDVAGLPTIASAPSYAYHPVSDATAVARLRRAVAIVIGKTNLDQFTRAGGHPLPLGRTAQRMGPQPHLRRFLVGFCSGGRRRVLSAPPRTPPGLDRQPPPRQPCGWTPVVDCPRLAEAPLDHPAPRPRPNSVGSHHKLLSGGTSNGMT